MYITIFTSGYSQSAANSFFSGTRITCPGKTVRDGSRFKIINSDGVVSKRAATDVKVSDGSTWNRKNTEYFSQLQAQ